MADVEEQVGAVGMCAHGDVNGICLAVADLIIAGVQADGNAELEVQEGANFLVKILFFPINAGTLLGLPVRQRKVKKLNQLLQALQAPPIEFPKGKRIKVKK